MSDSHKSILQEADELINGERNYTYDHPLDNFNRIKKGWEVIGNNQVGLVEIRKPRPAPFTEKEPAKPDFSAAEQEIENVQANKQAAKQTLEREITERRSSRLRAVTQGSRERPMLSKGVTLNG